MAKANGVIRLLGKQLYGIARRNMSDAPLTVKPTDYEKRVLVWTKRYPSLKDIPERIAPSILTRAKDKFRWRLAVIAMALSVVASGYMVYVGKSAAARGDTVLKRGLEWHEELRPGSTKH